MFLMFSALNENLMACLLQKFQHMIPKLKQMLLAITLFFFLFAGFAQASLWGLFKSREERFLEHVKEKLIEKGLLEKIKFKRNEEGGVLESGTVFMFTNGPVRLEETLIELRAFYVHLDKNNDLPLSEHEGEKLKKLFAVFTTAKNLPDNIPKQIKCKNSFPPEIMTYNKPPEDFPGNIPEKLFNQDCFKNDGVTYVEQTVTRFFGPIEARFEGDAFTAIDVTSGMFSGSWAEGLLRYPLFKEGTLHNFPMLDGTGVDKELISNKLKHKSYKIPHLVITDPQTPGIPDIGKGLFAGEQIDAGRIIGEYTGEVMGPVVNSGYCFQTEGYVVDGKEFGNHTRYVNYAPHENANLQHIFFVRNGLVIPHLITIMPVEEGQELLFDYGYDEFEGVEFYPMTPDTRRIEAAGN
jgi:hypothetical protein